MIEISPLLGLPLEGDLAAGPFAVDTPWGTDIGYGLRQCDADLVVWASQSRIHEMPPQSGPEYDPETDGIRFTSNEMDIVIRPFRSSDSSAVMGTVVPQTADDVRAYAEKVLASMLTTQFDTETGQ